MLYLPRGYLSYSAITCFKQSKERFKREYLEGGRKLSTKYLTLGKVIAELIENDKHKDILPNLPVFPIRELVIRTTINTVPVLCKIDDCKEDYTELRDKKTGKKPWSRAKTQKHQQLLMYACAIRSKYGVTPTKAWIDWIETTVEDISKTGLHNDAKVLITGKHDSYDRVFDERELNKFEEELLVVAQQISKFYEEWINSQID